MTPRRILATAVILVAGAALLSAQSAHRERRWAIYEHEMQNPADDPPDAWQETEFAFARLRFRSHLDGRFYARWGIDANKSERQFIQGLRRLTRVDARSVEQIVDVGSDEIFNWPWLYAVSIGDWTLNEDEVRRLRSYFERGGFLMVDDFHGEREWQNFAEGIARVLPDSTIIDLPDDHPIFHTVFDLSQRVRVPGLNVVHGSQIERGGVVPHWRAVVDPQGRVLVAACFNMDLGDAWEWADLPEYPERYASEAYRLGVNYVIYPLTH